MIASLREDESAGSPDDLVMLTEEHERLIPSAEQLIEDFDNGDNRRSALEEGREVVKISASEMLAGLKEAFADVSMGIVIAIRDGEPAVSWSSAALPERYRRETGRDLLADLGHNERQTRTMLRRGYLRDESEWRILNEYVISGILSESQERKASEMLARFEQAQSAR